MDVVAVDEHDDAGSVEGSLETDVVQLAVEAQADAAGVDSVVADPELMQKTARFKMNTFERSPARPTVMTSFPYA